MTAVKEVVLDNVLRPQVMADYVGQAKTIQRLTIAMNAAKTRSESAPHMLFHGPAGLGKTSCANLIAGFMGSQLHMASGPSLEKPMDILRILADIKTNDVVFVDEVHCIPTLLNEVLYPVLEDLRVDAVVEGKVINCRLPPFTFIGATTMAGKLSTPFRNRFGLVMHLEYYPPDDLAKILARSARILKVDIAADCILDIAHRSRGTPRIANTLLQRVRDYANGRRVDQTMLDATFDLEEIDRDGLDRSDHNYLNCLRNQFKGGPAGIMALASSMNEAKETLESITEPFLLHMKLIARTPRGRILLDK